MGEIISKGNQDQYKCEHCGYSQGPECNHCIKKIKGGKYWPCKHCSADMNWALLKQHEKNCDKRPGNLKRPCDDPYHCLECQIDDLVSGVWCRYCGIGYGECGECLAKIRSGKEYKCKYSKCNVKAPWKDIKLHESRCRHGRCNDMYNCKTCKLTE